MFYAMIAVSNLVVGAFVGLCGVAGFLLPMVYTGSLGMGVTEALALSFAAFIVSGVIGSVNYFRDGNLDIPFGIRLSIGSMAGAILGVRLNLIIPETQVKILLYLVVLLSGISILMRKDGRKAELKKSSKNGDFLLSEHLIPTLLLGFLTGMICALSGAGGPVLVMPLLVVMGTPVRTAVGVALFNSVFIGIPSAAGYMMKCSVKKLLLPLVTAAVFHGIGVYFGSRNAKRINQVLLKRGIAVFSIAMALWKLYGLFF